MRKSITICPGCNKAIVVGEKKFLHVNDHPYINIYWHSKCFIDATNEEKVAVLKSTEVIRWTK